MQDPITENDGLSAEERQVFTLLAEARNAYEEYLKALEAFGQNGFQMPTTEDYSWEKPLTVVLCR